MQHPTNADFASIKHILRYLKGTITLGLTFQSGSLQIHEFDDTDWAGSPIDRRSMSGFCIFLGPNLVSWVAKKQPTMAHSSMEAEYHALAQAAIELSWLTILLGEFHLPPPTPAVLWCDNISAIALASNPVFHACSKHIEVDYHFIREKVLANAIQVKHVSTVDHCVTTFLV